MSVFIQAHNIRLCDINGWVLYGIVWTTIDSAISAPNLHDEFLRVRATIAHSHRTHIYNRFSRARSIVIFCLVRDCVQHMCVMSFVYVCVFMWFCGHCIFSVLSFFTSFSQAHKYKLEHLVHQLSSAHHKHMTKTCVHTR